MHDYISTYTKEKFHYDDPAVDSINITDIAKGLSNTCRFSGQLEEFYSVAQHSVAVSEMLPPEYALEGLLHDAAEAYMSDITSPLKKLLPDYQELERYLMLVINCEFGVDFTKASKEMVKQADWKRLLWEARDLKGEVWEPETLLPTAKVFPLLPKDAYKQFMSKFEELTH